MTDDILLQPIGLIHSPYKNREGIPCQGIRSKETATVEVFTEFSEGLKDIDGFSHLILLYHFHQADKTQLVSKPFLDDQLRGIFAIRSPFRPNHIGLTIVELIQVNDNRLLIRNIDFLDQTPLLDIKPYVPAFDERSGVRIGWLEGKV